MKNKERKKENVKTTMKKEGKCEEEEEEELQCILLFSFKKTRITI